ncbi:MAG: hypothetical protein CM1200mP27_07710 [Chloroflexota bacterium]|nr:MAG: hypothetical protein CM1200mP27_07710 [Chloroflexota bacterium]
MKWTYEFICGNGEWGHIVETGGRQKQVALVWKSSYSGSQTWSRRSALPGVELDIVDREGEPITEPEKAVFWLLRSHSLISIELCSETPIAKRKIGTRFPVYT